MARHMISVNEALALIFHDTLEGDLEELSDEDQPCSATESEEQDAVVYNNGLSSPKKRQLPVESSDSLPTDFSTPIDRIHSLILLSLIQVT